MPAVRPQAGQGRHEAKDGVQLNPVPELDQLGRGLRDDRPWYIIYVCDIGMDVHGTKSTKFIDNNTPILYTIYAPDPSSLDGLNKF